MKIFSLIKLLDLNEINNISNDMKINKKNTKLTNIFILFSLITCILSGEKISLRTIEHKCNKNNFLKSLLKLKINIKLIIVLFLNA